MKHLLLAALAVFPTTAAARPMTAEDLATMRRVGAPAVSPDGRWLVYQQRETDLAANRGRLDLWLPDLRRTGAQPVRVASTPEHNEHDPAFAPDGRSLYFLGNASGKGQLWRVAFTPDGPAAAAPERLTDFANAIGGFRIAPSGDRLAVWADLDGRCADFNCANVPAAATDRGSARVYDITTVRYWDQWRRPGIQPRTFVLPMVDGRPQGAGVAAAIPATGEPTIEPVGGGEPPEWTADGRGLVYAWRAGPLGEESGDDVDLYRARAREGAAPVNLTPVNLTPANPAEDSQPRMSPDGRLLAYLATARPQANADGSALFVRDMTSGQARALTSSWDRSIASVAWAPDGRSLYLTAQDTLDTPF